MPITYVQVYVKHLVSPESLAYLLPLWHTQSKVHPVRYVVGAWMALYYIRPSWFKQSCFISDRSKLRSAAISCDLIAAIRLRSAQIRCDPLRSTPIYRCDHCDISLRSAAISCDPTLYKGWLARRSLSPGHDLVEGTSMKFSGTRFYQALIFQVTNHYLRGIPK